LGSRRNIFIWPAPADADLPLPPRNRFSVAMIAALRERRQQRQEMIFQKQHHADDDVAFSDVGAAAFERPGISGEFGGGVDAQRQTGNLSHERRSGSISRAGDMCVHGDDDDPHGLGVNVRNGLLHRTGSRS
jgi:hypothetical protein